MNRLERGSSAEAPPAHYIRAVQRCPMLSLEEEQELARRWREARDDAAKDRLVTSHMRLVLRIASSFRGYGLAYNDLVSVGSIGLMQALKGYDPGRGFRFATYAMWWIRAAIQEYVLHTRSLVKIGTTSAQKRLFFRLRQLKADMHIIDDAELQPEQVREIAAALKVPEGEVIAMDRRIAAADHSLNAPLAIGGEGKWLDLIRDESDNQEILLAEREVLDCRTELLPQALAVLNQRELHIIRERRLRHPPVTLDGLARHYGVSRERIRQIEMNALGKLGKSMRLQLAQRRRKAATLQSQ